MPNPAYVRALAPFLAFLAACLAATGIGVGATSSVNVTLSVATSTQIDLAGCPAGARAFGTVLPSTPATTPSDCTIQFGATGATGRLRVRQQDGTGVGMFSWTNGQGDPAWGTNGIVDIPGGASTDWLAGTVVTSTGHVLRGGNFGTDGYRIARLTPTGALDTVGYGGGDGIASLDPSGAGTFDHAHALDAFPDGSAIITGHSTFATQDATFIRFTPAGLLDTNWGAGDDGVTNFSVAAGPEEPYDVQVQPDGSVLASGFNGGADQMWIAKLDPDGILDTSFGGGDGIATVSAGGSGEGGRLIVDGPTGDIYWSGRVALVSYFAKFDRRGNLVTGWGASGIRTVNVPGMADDLAGPGFIDSAGRLVVIGSGDGTLSYLIRLNTAGAPDPTFGTNGVVTHDPWGTRDHYFDGGELVLRGDDRFCGSGGGEPVTAGAYRMFAVCFNADGSLDTSFGSGGYAIFNATENESVDAGMWSRDGALYMGAGENNRLVTVRMGGDTQSIPDYSHPGTTFASAGGAFGACLRQTSNATATWPVAPGNACTGDGTHWRGIPATTAGAGTEIATAAAGQLAAQASLRFGARSSATAKGSFLAPVTFEVVGL